MNYRVHFTDSAAFDADAAYAWIAERNPEAAVEWFNGLFDVIDSLEMLPTRCAVAPEKSKETKEIRQLLYGRRPHVYRILFAISGKDVYVLNVRHGRRRVMAASEIVLPPELD